MKNFLLLVALILSFAFDANAATGSSPTTSSTFVDTNDTTSSVICKHRTDEICQIRKKHTNLSF
nr:hypothetical protein [Wolbachia endosymbiont (group A) of Volucella inflata]